MKNFLKTWIFFIGCGQLFNAVFELVFDRPLVAGGFLYSIVFPAVLVLIGRGVERYNHLLDRKAAS